MAAKDFSITVLVDQSPAVVFDAINNVRGWWSEEVAGTTDKLHGEFAYHYKDVHQCKMKIVEFVKDQKVVWLVLDNYFNFTEDKREWKGTKISFEIKRVSNGTEIRFDHLGLVPEYECFSICSDAWTNYISKSLYNLIVSGKGEPNPKEGGYNEMLLQQHSM